MLRHSERLDFHWFKVQSRCFSIITCNGSVACNYDSGIILSCGMLVSYDVMINLVAFSSLEM